MVPDGRSQGVTVRIAVTGADDVPAALVAVRAYVYVVFAPAAVTGALTEIGLPRSDAETEEPPTLVTVEGNPAAGVTVSATLLADPIDSDGKERVRVGEVPPVMVDGTNNNGLEKTGRGTTLRVPVADTDVPAALAMVKV